MQLKPLLTICVAALTGTASAIPHVAGPYHGAHIPIHVPTNATSSHNATTTGTRGKAPLSTGSARNGTARTHAPMIHHGINHVNVNHCHELCSLEAQTCSLAVPDDDEFW
jgi:hypothetical protein